MSDSVVQPKSTVTVVDEGFAVSVSMGDSEPLLRPQAASFIPIKWNIFPRPAKSSIYAANVSIFKTAMLGTCTN
jgi:hypothetical protein